MVICINRILRSGFTPVTVVSLLWTVMTAGPVIGQTEADRFELGYPGYLIIAAARDTTLGFSWQDGPAPGFRSLVWEAGLLSFPDSLSLEHYAVRDLAIPVGPQLAGAGQQGNLVLRDGDYEISEPILLTDGIISLHAAAGRLEIQGQRIRYRPPNISKDVDPRANFLLLGGVLLLVVVLLRRARRLSRRGE